MDFVDGIDIVFFFRDCYLNGMFGFEVIEIIIVVVEVFDYVYECWLLYCDVKFVNILIVNFDLFDC